MFFYTSIESADLFLFNMTLNAKMIIRPYFLGKLINKLISKSLFFYITRMLTGLLASTVKLLLMKYGQKL